MGDNFITTYLLHLEKLNVIKDPCTPVTREDYGTIIRRRRA